MRKCVFAGDWVLEKMVGVQRYTYQVLKALDNLIITGEIDLEVELLVPCNSDWINPFEKIKVVNRGKITSKIEKHLWQQLVFPHYVIKNKAIGVDMAAAMPIWGCHIVAIHDCIHEAFPENFVDHPKHQKIYLTKVKRIVKNKKCHIITLTNDSKNEIKKYYNVSDERISLVSCGWEHMKSIELDEGIFEAIPEIKDKDYFFSLGSKYRHKNFQWVLATARKNPKYYFVITGTDSFSNNSDDLLMKKPDNVIYTGYISDGEIKALMQKCKALIQPSLYEGFGLPPLEAMSQGSPIIISKASCLPEIYKNSAYYINPNTDGCELDNLMSTTIDNAEVILEEYTWENAAKSFIKVLSTMKSED